ncbi:MAG TPA: tetratricopeptide repeat protein [Flavobacterium sp.]
MKYKIIILALLCFWSCKEKKIRGEVTATKQIDSLELILWNFEHQVSSEQKQILNNKAFEIALQLQNDSLSRERLFQIANNFFTLKEWNSFKKTSNIALEHSISDRDTNHIAKAYRYNAEYYKNLKFSDSAFYFYLKSEKLYTKLNDKINLGKIFLKKGILQFYANDYLGSDLSTSQAYNLLRTSADKQSVYQVITMMGIIANEMKDYEEAIKKHTEALQLVRDFNLNNDLNQEATSLNNIGNVYQNIGRHHEAIKNFNLALKKPNLYSETPDLYAILLDNLAYSKLKLNQLNNLPNLFYQALKIRERLRMSSGVVVSKIHLSEYYHSLSDTSTSQQFAKEALKLAQETQTPVDILSALKQLSLVEHKSAALYSTDYIRINDSLQQAERKSQNKLARIQLETDEILGEKDKLAEQNRNLLYFFMATFFIGLLLFVIRNQRAKNRELLLKQAQQKANEEIYNLMITQQNTIEESRMREKKRIAQELHDGVLGRLFGVRLNLDSLNRSNNETAIIKRNNYLDELKYIEQDIREISHDLNREKFNLINNFTAILSHLLEEQRSSYMAEVVTLIDEGIDWDTIDNTLKINLYRIIQESLQNINKYAYATHISVQIKKFNENLALNISDNGQGFNTDIKKKGIGIQNMISRTQELEGKLEITSKKGKGTFISASFPIRNSKVLV